MTISCDFADLDFSNSFDEFSPIVSALRQLSSCRHVTSQGSGIREINSSNTAAKRLAHLIQNSSEKNSLINNSESISNHEHGSSSKDSAEKFNTHVKRSSLLKELSVVHALGFAAKDIIDTSTRQRIIESIHKDIAKSVYECFLKDHYIFGENHSTNSESTRDLDQNIQTWFSLQDARRAVFQCSLRKRFGTLENVATSVCTTGVPLVLYIMMERKTLGKDVTDMTSSSVEGWKDVLCGTALLEVVTAESIENLRSTLTKPLRAAIKNRTVCPTLVVVNTGEEGYLAEGIETIKAVCDIYGIHVHAEGKALSFLLTGSISHGMPNDIGQFVRESHSSILDLGSWFGNYTPAIVTCCDPSMKHGSKVTKTSMDSHLELSLNMAFWYKLARIDILLQRKVLHTLCDRSITIADLLHSVHSVLECKSVGSCGDTLISYAAPEESIKIRETVNRTLLTLLREKDNNLQHLLTIRHIEGSSWLYFSPVQAIAYLSSYGNLSRSFAEDIAIDFIRIARSCEAATKGRAAFQAQIRQFKDVEVDNIAYDFDSSNFYYCGICVTPLGEVSQNGHWKRDKEMVSTVKRMTIAVSEYLKRECSQSIHATVRIEEKDGIAVLYLGPVLPKLPDDVTSTERHDGQKEVIDCIRIADEWDLSDSQCQDLALDSARLVGMAVKAVLLQSPEDATHTRKLSVDLKHEENNSVEDRKELPLDHRENEATLEESAENFAGWEKEERQPLQMEQNTDLKDEEEVLPEDLASAETMAQTPVEDTILTNGKGIEEHTERNVVRIIVPEPLDERDQKTVHKSEMNMKTSQENDEQPEQPERQQEPVVDKASTAKKGASRFWGMLFGQRDNGSESDSEPEYQEKGEDDYFRI